jgi:hypothetical protein
LAGSGEIAKIMACQSLSPMRGDECRWAADTAGDLEHLIGEGKRRA